MNTFQALGLQERLLRAIETLGFVEPTPIQQEAIPQLISENRDLIGLAQTGTGKTAAFGLPMLEKIDMGKNYPQALVLAPTRELCVQITKDLVNFGSNLDGFATVAVYGGANISEQIRSIKRGVQVVVATPGRLIDLINRRALDLGRVEIVVLDEADEMLNMGFKEDIDFILSSTPEHRNTWLFSATMPREVRQIAESYMSNPIELSVGKREQGNENIEHVYYVVRAKDRYLALKRIADANPDVFGIVFCRTKLESQEVAEHLIRDGYNADALHGDLSQQQRDKVMGRYREKSLQLLVATDVAARGIDVQDVTHVINYNLPDELENYMHRSGRTARAGKKGISISIINIKEVSKIRQIERSLKRSFIAGKVPEGIEVCEKQLMHLVKRVHDVEVNEKEIAPYLDAIYGELQDIDKEELIRRFVSIEFNRFLEYYRKAPDLNVDANSSRSSSSGEVGGYRQSSGPRMFVSVGAKDGLDKGKLLRLLCDESGERGTIFGRIDVKGVYSFVDVQPDKLDAVMKAIHGIEYNGRTVRTELTTEKPGGDRGERSDRGDRSDRGGFRKEGGSGYSRGSRDGGSSRGPRSSGGDRGSRGGSRDGGYRGSRDGAPREGGYSRAPREEGAPRAAREEGAPRGEGFSRPERAPRSADFGKRDDSRSSSEDKPTKSRKEKFSKW
ncbi:MAG TPA: DEAD/DEAH box helicase [Bacteroidia bacterium]|jgi:ATP-dependent RNA helicase DeaD|nr:DEAD/DEAH box helicase [Bacteroidia bacterium]